MSTSPSKRKKPLVGASADRHRALQVSLLLFMRSDRRTHGTPGEMTGADPSNEADTTRAEMRSEVARGTDGGVTRDPQTILAIDGGIATPDTMRGRDIAADIIKQIQFSGQN